MTMINIPDTNNKRIVIIGGGFGGLTLTKCLKKTHFQVILIDKNNYHTFQPLLYQVATGGLEADAIAYPLRKVVRKYDNLYFRMAEVKTVDPDNHIIHTTIGDLSYDHLVIATGSQPNYFNFESIKEKLFVMKTIPESLDIRSYLLQNFESALSVLSKNDQEEKLNVVIIGGGPTGVELAGALAEMKRHSLPKDYPELDFSRMHIHLYEASNQLLAVMSDEASESSLKTLAKMGVEIHLNAKVIAYDGAIVKIDDNSTIASDTVIWTAGVKGTVLSGLEKAVAGNRYQVSALLELINYPDHFAIGDVAANTSQELPKGHPMLASVAVQQAKFLSDHFKGRNPNSPFIYKDKGSMATIGRNKAVADLGRFRIQGFIAWFLWVTIHLLLLAGFRNRIVTLLDWVWNYFSYDRAFRLIIRPFVRK